ncbi:unnamed protein product [Trichobilharzia szidati]|nr:unnamed protein product [Trichobilharzia szidati]
MSFWSLLLCFVLLSTSGIQASALEPWSQQAEFDSRFRNYTYNLSNGTLSCRCYKNLTDAELENYPPGKERCPKCEWVR